MIQVTAPAVAIVLVVGYLGINAIAGAIENLFGCKKKDEKDRK